MGVTAMTESFVHQARAGDAETMDAWLARDTECGALIAALDWSTSPLGDIADWPASLRTAVSIAMRSPAATMVMWGAAGVMLYNDAFIAIAGARHPSTFGMPVREGWPEVADFSDNVLRVVLSGSALSYTAQPLTLMRNGVVERVTLNLDYMPVFDEDGRPAGVFSVNTEIADAAAQIQVLDKQTAEAQGAAQTLVKPEFKKLAAPIFDLDDFKAIAASEFEQIQDGADALVKKHFAEHLGNETERWVSHGLQHKPEQDCPFCGQ